MRCFVAVTPGEAVLQQLETLSERLHRHYPGARRLRSANLHLTLAFIGELSDSGAQPAAHAVRSMRLEPFDWRLDRVGYFARAGVVWVGSQDEDPELSVLALRVRGTLRALKVPYDPKPFVAHVSLLRDVPAQHRGPGDAAPPPGPIEPVFWRIDSADLLVSEADPRGAVRYRPL